MMVIAGERAAKGRVGVGISIADQLDDCFPQDGNPPVGRGSRPAH